jgi:hypothetical protein
MLAHLEGAHGYSNIVSASTYQFLHTLRTGSYGIGWYVWSNGTLSHTGMNGKWRARVRVIPGEDAGLLVATNADNTPAADGTTKLLELVASRVANTP